MKNRFFFVSLTALLLLAGCTTYDRSRPVIQQGNLLTETKIKRLHTGMNKQDTAILMGDSLISPTFNHDRWDYAYTLQKGAQKPEIHHVSLYFSNNRLIKIDHNT